MNNYVKTFLLRGLMFGGFGPIILGIVYCILEKTIADFSLTGSEVFIGILSTYLIAFVQAGVSVFNQIEEWPIAKSLLFHFCTLYLVYVIAYLVNTWIPFIPAIIGIFTVIFAAIYFLVWFTVYICVKITSKKFNKELRG